MSNLLYQTAIARIIYYRAPGKLPDYNNANEVAKYYKSHYNTIQGAANVAEVEKFYKKEILKNV